MENLFKMLMNVFVTFMNMFMASIQHLMELFKSFFN